MKTYFCIWHHFKFSDSFQKCCFLLYFLGMLNNHAGLGGKGDDDIALSDHENEGELGSDADNEDISDVNDDSRHQNSKSSNQAGSDLAAPVAASAGAMD